MKHIIRIFSLFLLAMFTLTPAQAQTPGDEDSSPVAIVGRAESANAAFLPSLYPNPTVALIDVSNRLKGQPKVFVPDTAQILGSFTQPLFPGPGEFLINLPIEPGGASIDLDNNGQTDPGVQVFALIVSSNLVNDSYLQQLEQFLGLTSYLTKIDSEEITEGTFVVYAPDDQQGFPSASGDDGQWFTADDPTITLPQGYSVATLNADGTVSFDRSRQPAINTRERAEEAAPDFSEQGVLESFNSLIDLLKKRYAYTELRGLDWDAIRAKYLPEVETADANQDFGAYYLTLHHLAQSIQDAHVGAKTINLNGVTAQAREYGEQIAGSLGAQAIAVSDPSNPEALPGDTIVVLTVGEDSPAAEAGWVPGTEIVSIDGQPPAARYDTLPLPVSVGTEETARVVKTRLMLSFPLSQTVTLGYRLPHTSEVLTATMTAGDYDTGYNPAPARAQTPITYEQVGDYAVIRWSDFISLVTAKIAVLEEALDQVHSRDHGGVILDLRRNSGGWVQLYETMASYFFTQDKPMPLHVFDWYYYDQTADQLIKSSALDLEVSAPRPELAYTGPVVVLVDELCASACEYFSQHLQTLGRAKVVGQYSSVGAGGPIDRVDMPGGITFQYTMGRTTFAGTDEFNLEAKGVVPDVRVPVTLESEQAKLNGEDPVLEAAMAVLDEQVAAAADVELAGTSWQWTTLLDTSAKEVAIDNPAAYTLTFAADGTVAIQADCNQAAGDYTFDADGGLTITPGPTTLALCPGESRSEDYLAWLGAASGFELDGGQLIIVLDSSSGALALGFGPVE